jgi:hypothetical protein
MIGYSLLDDIAAPTQQPVPQYTTRHPQKIGKNPFIKIKTECDLVVLGFILATILLLISDLNK